MEEEVSDIGAYHVEAEDEQEQLLTPVPQHTYVPVPLNSRLARLYMRVEVNRFLSEQQLLDVRGAGVNSMLTRKI